jgi:hypothetical protein
MIGRHKGKDECDRDADNRQEKKKKKETQE